MPGTEKMKHVSLTLQVENDLKHQLSIGALKPGARLITKNLAEQLGMSITPVREAITSGFGECAFCRTSASIYSSGSGETSIRRNQSDPLRAGINGSYSGC